MITETTKIQNSYLELEPQFKAAYGRYEKGERAFPDAARAFYQMKKSGWRDCGVRLWRDFLKFLGLESTYAYRLISAGRILELLDKHSPQNQGWSELPMRDIQFRKLNRFKKDGRLLALVWGRAIELAGKERITGKIIQHAIDELVEPKVVPLSVRIEAMDVKLAKLIDEGIAADDVIPAQAMALRLKERLQTFIATNTETASEATAVVEWTAASGRAQAEHPASR